MGRIKGNLPWTEVKAKGIAIGKAVRLLGQLDSTLDMERGGKIADNLHNLYGYMLNRLTVANVTNDPQIVAEVAALVRKIKSGWDQIVADEAR
jgi:flagellar protein FliS